MLNLCKATFLVSLIYISSAFAATGCSLKSIYSLDILNHYDLGQNRVFSEVYIDLLDEYLKQNPKKITTWTYKYKANDFSEKPRDSYLDSINEYHFENLFNINENLKIKSDNQVYKYDLSKRGYEKLLERFLIEKIRKYKFFFVSQAFSKLIAEGGSENFIKKLNGLDPYSKECLFLVTEEGAATDVRVSFQKISEKTGVGYCHISDKKSAEKCLGRAFRLGEPTQQEESRFRYSDGLCINKDGKIGLNKFDENYYSVNPNDLSCHDFSGVDFNEYPYSLINSNSKTRYDGSEFFKCNINSKIKGIFNDVSIIDCEINGELSNSRFIYSRVYLSETSSGLIKDTVFDRVTFKKGVVLPNVSFLNVSFLHFSTKKSFLIEQGIDVAFEGALFENNEIRVLKKSDITMRASRVANVSISGVHYTNFHIDSREKNNSINIKASGRFVLKGSHFNKINVVKNATIVQANYDVDLLISKSYVENIYSKDSSLMLQAVAGTVIDHSYFENNLNLLMVLNSSKVFSLKTHNDSKFKIHLNNSSLLTNLNGEGSLLELKLRKSEVVHSNFSKMNNNLEINSFDSSFISCDLNGLKSQNKEAVISETHFLNVNIDNFYFDGQFSNNFLFGIKGSPDLLGENVLESL